MKIVFNARTVLGQQGRQADQLLDILVQLWVEGINIQVSLGLALGGDVALMLWWWCQSHAELSWLHRWWAIEVGRHGWAEWWDEGTRLRGRRKTAAGQGMRRWREGEGHRRWKLRVAHRTIRWLLGKGLGRGARDGQIVALRAFGFDVGDGADLWLWGAVGVGLRVLRHVVAIAAAATTTDVGLLLAIGLTTAVLLLLLVATATIAVATTTIALGFDVDRLVKIHGRL